jgi:hypothetical protein
MSDDKQENKLNTESVRVQLSIPPTAKVKTEEIKPKEEVINSAENKADEKK